MLRNEITRTILTRLNTIKEVYLDLDSAAKTAARVLINELPINMTEAIEIMNILIDLLEAAPITTCNAMMSEDTRHVVLNTLRKGMIQPGDKPRIGIALSTFCLWHTFTYERQLAIRHGAGEFYGDLYQTAVSEDEGKHLKVIDLPIGVYNVIKDSTPAEANILDALIRGKALKGDTLVSVYSGTGKALGSSELILLSLMGYRELDNRIKLTDLLALLPEELDHEVSDELPSEQPLMEELLKYTVKPVDFWRDISLTFDAESGALTDVYIPEGFVNPNTVLELTCLTQPSALNPEYTSVTVPAYPLETIMERLRFASPTSNDLMVFKRSLRDVKLYDAGKEGAFYSAHRLSLGVEESEFDVPLSRGPRVKMQALPGMLAQVNRVDDEHVELLLERAFLEARAESPDLVTLVKVQVRNGSGDYVKHNLNLTADKITEALSGASNAALTFVDKLRVASKTSSVIDLNSDDVFIDVSLESYDSSPVSRLVYQAYDATIKDKSIKLVHLGGNYHMQ